MDEKKNQVLDKALDAMSKTLDKINNGDVLTSEECAEMSVVFESVRVCNHITQMVRRSDDLLC